MTCCSRCSRSAKRGPHSVATHYVLHFDSVVELHPIDDLREPFEPAQSSPAALGAQTELVDHREHSVAGQTSFRAIGPVAHGGEARLDHVRAADVDRNHLRVMTIAGAVERQFLAAQWSPRTSAFVERDRQQRVDVGRSNASQFGPIADSIDLIPARTS
jgi:hypothetical protein